MIETTSKEEIWSLVECFYRAKELFYSQYEHYEALVKEYVKNTGIPRENLHLSTEEISALLDLKSIEKLRDNYLRNLREVSHHMFRRGDASELFDRYVSDLYHETSILKEQHYTVRTLAKLYESGNKTDLQERDKILNEVHEFFPRKLNQIRELFIKAQQQLELLLKSFNKEKVLVRSLWLFGNEVLQNTYKGGIEGLYEIIYPEIGALEGYLTAAESFASSKFTEQAKEAIKKAKVYLKNTTSANNSLEKIRKRIKEIEKSL